MFLGNIHPYSWVVDITRVGFALGVDFVGTEAIISKEIFRLPFTPLWSLSAGVLGPSITWAIIIIFLRWAS
ncbi:hypothetical protein EF849_21760, partial [Aeromonas jandaei]|nr:hypothetical protein [Aeromonas jandaei]